MKIYKATQELRIKSEDFQAQLNWKKDEIQELKKAKSDAKSETEKYRIELILKNNEIQELKKAKSESEKFWCLMVHGYVLALMCQTWLKIISELSIGNF